jgi:competence protein ComEA
VLAAARAAVTAPAATATATPIEPPAPPARIGVGILGAVENEGLYYFDQGARVRDLLQAAGGEQEDADLSDVNRTALLIDQTTLLVPRVISQGGEYYSDPPVTYNPAPYTRSTWYQFNKKTETAQASVAGGTGGSATGASGGLIDINTATQAELETLPGIGPATAQKIIAHRQSAPFQTIEDLDNVSGIGPAKMNALRGMITVR